MKTIKEGVIPKPALPFWVGLVLTCGHCGHQVELEEGDKPHVVTPRGKSSVAHLLRGAKAVITVDQCPTCNKAITHTHTLD